MPVGSTWSKSRSAYCAANVWIAGSTIPTASSAKSPHGRSNEMPPALASNGCSQSTRHAPKWAGPILSRPKSHNHWAEVLVQLYRLDSRKVTVADFRKSAYMHAGFHIAER